MWYWNVFRCVTEVLLEILYPMNVTRRPVIASVVAIERCFMVESHQDSPDLSSKRLASQIM